MDSDQDDELVSVLPIYFSNHLAPNIHVHQFPLLTRPLRVPPSSSLSGKSISARIKPDVRRLEIHVPADLRPEVWNAERAKEFGTARAEDDREKNQEAKGKMQEGEEPKLKDVRLRSEEVNHKGTYMLGIIRDNRLHLHPIDETHQLRPTLTYLDILSRKNKRSYEGASDSDSDDGPPLGPDQPSAAVVPKKEKKAGEMKEVHVTTRKTDDKAGVAAQGGLSTVRREMLHSMRVEEDEEWQNLEFCDVTSSESGAIFESVFSQKEDDLECKSNMSDFLKTIKGL